MRIAVLGGGNGSYAAAADLAEQGHEVRLWRRDARALAPLIESPRIVLDDHHGRRDVAIATATPEAPEALRDAELVLAPCPPFAQDELARTIAPHLRDRDVVYLPTGSLGA